MKRPNPLAVLSTIAADVIPQLLDKSKPDAEKLDLALSCVPDVMQALAKKQEGEDRARRVDFIAHHAAMLCQTTIETTEDDDGLKAAARRAVKLAAYVLDYAETQEGVTS